VPTNSSHAGSVAQRVGHRIWQAVETHLRSHGWAWEPSAQVGGLAMTWPKPAGTSGTCLATLCTMVQEVSENIR
jgi:hypothetical protein